MQHGHIPDHIGLVRHAGYTGITENTTKLRENSLTYLIGNIHILASKINEYERIVIFHSPMQRAVLTADAFRVILAETHTEVEVQRMKILSVDKRQFTKQALEDEVLLAEKEGVRTFFLFITHEPVIDFYFKQQGLERIPVQVCEIITSQFTIPGHAS